MFCILHHTIVVEIQAGNTVVALGPGRLFFNGNRPAFLVKLHNAEPLRVVHIVAKYRGALAGFCIFHRSTQPLVEAMSSKDVIAQHHGNRVISDKIRANDKCLSKAVRRRLHSIAQVHAELPAIPQQILEPRSVLRR